MQSNSIDPQNLQSDVTVQRVNNDVSSIAEQHNLNRNIPISNTASIPGSNYIETKGPDLPVNAEIKSESIISEPATPPTPIQIKATQPVAINNIEKIEIKDNLEKINNIPNQSNNDKEVYKEQLDDLLTLAVEKNASDLHIAVGYPPMLRIDGDLVNIGTQELTKTQTQTMLTTILPSRLMEELDEKSDVDMSYEHKTGNRFRVNIFNSKGTLAGAFRLIPSKIKSISELNLPQICYDLLKVPQGLILLTGPTGSGKSTSIAAMIQEINLNFNKHIITIEDPIEYVFPKAKAMVNQRELGVDAITWNRALREILRQDPNVVLVGEMRDFETISSAITVAETGHLVFATLHTNSASQTVDRLIDVFPEGQQNQIRSQLANVIVAVIAQRLIPISKGGRKAIFEVMVATPGIKNAIREGKTYQIDNMIQTNADLGMITLEKSLLQVIRSGDVTVEEAVNYTSKPDELMGLLNSGAVK